MAAIGEVDTDAAATEGADLTDFEVRDLRNCALILVLISASEPSLPIRLVRRRCLDD